MSKGFVKEIFANIFSHFWKFIKRLYVFAFFFGLPYSISFIVAMLIPRSLELIGLSNTVSAILTRILLTIAPAIPTGAYTLFEAEDQYDEFSMDLCFVVWIATIAYAWKFL